MGLKKVDIFSSQLHIRSSLDMKAAINDLYKNFDQELNQSSFSEKLHAILTQPEFDSSTLRASLLKEILHCLPEPICMNGYSKVFEVIPKMDKYQDKLQLLNMIFLILPR